MGEPRRAIILLGVLLTLALPACDCGGRTVQSRANIEAEPSLLDFGSVRLGATATATVAIKNTGRAALEISDLAIVDDAASRFFITAESGRSIATAGSASVTISFRAPSTVGLANARLRIDSNAENAPTFFVPLVGAGAMVAIVDAGADGGVDAGAGADAGIDGGVADGGEGDGGGVDSGTPDSGAVDAGEVDASVPDAGGTDAGEFVVTDGGVFRCVATIGAAGQDYAVDVAFDRSGSLLLTGYFENTITIGSDTLISAGGRDVFLSKYGAACQPLWARSLAGNAGHDFGAGVATDQSNNVFAVGYFLGSVQVPSGPALTSAGAIDLYVLSLDADAGHRWSARYGGGGSDVATSVAVTADGGVLVGGSGGSALDFGGGLLAFDGGADIFVASFDSTTGSHRWSKMYGGNLLDQSSKLTCRADGQPTLVGSFYSSSINFGDGPLTSTGGSVGFVATLETGGLATWSRALASTGSLAYASAEGVAVSASGETYVAGTFEGSLTFGTTTLTSTAGGYDGFLAKFSSTGAPVWIRQYGDSGPDGVVSVVVLSDGSLIAAGLFRGTVDFGGGPLVSAGGLDIFVMRLTSGGSHVWSRRFGSTADDHGVALAVNETAFKVAVVGKFEGTVNFGSGPITTTGPAGSGDAFLLLLGL